MFYKAKAEVFGYTNFYVLEAATEAEVKPRVINYIVDAVANPTVSIDLDEWNIEVEQLQFEPGSGVAYIGTTGE